MKKVSIYKNQSMVQFAKFEDLEAVNIWLDDLKKNYGWGKPEGFYPLSELSESELAQEIERKTQDEFGNDLIEPLVKIPAQYEITIEDITAQIEAEKKIQDAVNAQNLGNKIICKVWAINDAKNYTTEEMQTLFSDASLLSIERCLRNGALLTAKALINDLDSSFFTANEKQEILNMFEG